MSNETPTPESVHPESVQPESVQPESVQPESVQPAATQPEGAADAVDAADSVDAPDADEPTSEAQPQASDEAAQDGPGDAQPESEVAPGAVDPAAADTAADETASDETASDETAAEETAANETGADDGEPSGETPTPETPTPVTPTPAPPVRAPSPAALAAKIAAARPAAPAAPPQPAHSESARFGRVDEDGTVFVVSGEEERAVGSYPGATSEEALQYFARKYDELFGMADLLQQRIAASSELSAKEAAEQLSHLSEQMSEPAFVGDLAALQTKLDGIATAIESRREEESAARAAAKAAAAVEREALVARAEKIAAQDPSKVQWKRSGEELRGLFDEWKAHQRSSAKLDKSVESNLWQRFSAARTSFDKSRRAHFAELETTQAEAKTVKERLVKEAESLAKSKDWGQTARDFKQLMDRWRAAGRAGRAEDDALWARFKAAQDSFFEAKDAVTAAEEEVFRGNLAVKEELMKEASALLPLGSDLEATKTALRSIQDRWDKAGKVPRADIERTEKALRRVEQAVREAEEKKWSSSNPEARARAQSLIDQLESAVASLEKDLAAAQEKGNEKKVKEAEAALQARQAWLEQARAGLDEFS